MEITGTISAVLPIQEGTSKAGKPWRKRFFVLDTNDSVPRKIAFSVFGDDRVNTFSAIAQQGTPVRLSFDIDCREWNGRWFTELQGWRIERLDQAAAPAQPAYQQPAAPAMPAAGPAVPPPPPAISGADASDDLPF